MRLANTPGLTPRFQARLVAGMGSATAVLRASPQRLRHLPGVDGPHADLVSSAPGVDEALAELARVHRARAVLLWQGGPRWPPGLADLSDPPQVLFARGRLDWVDAPAVAVVGSRRVSPYGRACARRIGAELAALGIVVVSGLARGVDTAAHVGALSVGGRTVAVLGGGLARLYPPENVGLAREIVAGSGAVLSEFALDMPPRPYHFPRRNRILAALSRAVVVVEAGEKSGSLITADHALDLGREVLAVPGRSDHPNSRGTHRLLREGAALCEGAADVLRALGVESVLPETGRNGGSGGVGAPSASTEGEQSPQPAAQSPVEAVLLSHLVGVERHADELVALGELEPGPALAALSMLALRGVLEQGPDGRWGRLLG